MSMIRDIMVREALSVVGFHGGDHTRADFDLLLGPPYGWPLDKPYGKGGLSTCAMVALGILRRLNPDCPAILDGYAIASGLGEALTWARRIGAVRYPRDGGRPLPGDIVQLTGPMHALVCVDWEEGNLVSVDGGQVHPRDGLQCISLVHRPWICEGKVSRLGTRVADCWIDLDSLVWRHPWC
jgi:hypothetical protein